MEIKSLLSRMLEVGASDLHLREGNYPVLRVDGSLQSLTDQPRLSKEGLEKLLGTMLETHQQQAFAQYGECDFSIAVAELGRFRGNVFRQRGAIHIALRVVPTQIPSIEELKLPAILKKLSENARGLILVTGTTGCGKSTTLAAMIELINSARPAHIITIEDPIEFVYLDKKSIISQRELGSDTRDYAEALKHIVRQDPDVILLGEMRDLETMAAALTAAQTGHLVLSTIHTVDAVQTISRIVDLFPPHQQNQIRLQLADTLKGAISQRLLPHSSGKGRVPAVEVLVVTPLVRKLIEENNLAEITNTMKQGTYYGMQTFNQALLKLYNSGEVKLEEALLAASNPEELMLAVRGIESGNESRNIFES